MSNFLVYRERPMVIENFIYIAYKNIKMQCIFIQLMVDQTKLRAYYFTIINYT